ncbi:hypothetical protein [Clostridium paridis]|uniref:Uncharacterized protein n=1 Tax=Clostridium paridis TaxID=2803863 RepID=A0A937FF76_9CLOT|nr:hypothetical protein [Clostridium paridis]MBL4932724.1 hypothetical protein [Clostridium paridis]
MEESKIKVSGFLTPEELNNISLSQGSLFQDKDNLFLSQKSNPLKALTQVNMSMKILSFETIECAKEKLLFFEGIKKFKIEYNDIHDELVQLNKSVSVNGCIKVPLNFYVNALYSRLIKGYFYIADSFTINYYICFFVGYSTSRNESLNNSSIYSSNKKNSSNDVFR